MAADYIPEKDVDASLWMSWFAYCISQQPDVYRTTAEDAAQLVSAVGAFSAAFTDASSPGMKCKSLVSAKNSAAGSGALGQAGGAADSG